MKFNYKPRDIQVYREFPVTDGEITLFFENDTKKDIYIYRRVIIRDSATLPVAEGRLGGVANAASYISLSPGAKITASLLMNAENLLKLDAGQEYNALIQYNHIIDFAWADKMLANLDIFQNWDADSGSMLLDEIARMLPVDFETVQFHVRKLLDGSHMDLCMDFGTSFSTCALALDPAKSRRLACFRSTDEPSGIYYTHFATGDGGEKSIVPSAMVLYRIGAGDKITWLCGFEAVNWAKKNPEKGSFVTDIKNLLLNLNEKKRYFDVEGNPKELSNEEVAKSYLNFLVERSKRYFGVDFRNVHITTPVAYPERQRLAYERILRDLGFDSIKNKLDEARAPLYHFLSSKVEKNRTGRKDENARDMGEKSLSYLIIDCGGGSTDATLLRGISLEPPLESQPHRGVIMRTQEPERGGNPDFGGSDLTDLLFHYLKMRICAAAMPLKFENLDPALGQRRDYLIDKLIETQEQNIFWELYLKEKQNRMEGTDDNEVIPLLQHEQAYGRFDAIAAKVEELFPTDEEHNGDLDRDTWEKIHSNRSTVWQLAELLKVNIFATDAPRTINLDELPDAPNATFWLRENRHAPLARVDGADLKPNLYFQTYELTKLFRPIIFKEISRISRQLNIKTDLSGENTFFNVRFVGQTTNIPLFNEALAYFVPRAMIEEEDREYQSRGSSRFQRIPAEEKKICCVTGAANFLRHISRGYLNDENFVASSRVLKNFCLFDANGQPTKSGVYDVNCNPSERLIRRNAPISEARGAVVRTLAEDMEEFFGTTYDEHIRLEGWLNFRRSDMTHPLSEEERALIEERWGVLLHNLGADPEYPGVLLQVELLEDGAAQRYEFRPYYWDTETEQYFTTPEPLQMCYDEE